MLFLSFGCICLQSNWLCTLCKKKQDLLLKTGKWFHGKEAKKHNPAKEIEYHLLTTPPTTPKSKASSPKIVKTGFPASSVTKAQLEEHAEEKKRKKLSNEGRLTGSDLDSDGSASVVSQKSSGGSQKKHVTFESINYTSVSNLQCEINNNNNNIENSDDESVSQKRNLKVYVHCLHLLFTIFSPGTLCNFHKELKNCMRF